MPISASTHRRRRVAMALALSLILVLTVSGPVVAATVVREVTAITGAATESCVTDAAGTEVCQFVEVSVASTGANWEVCVTRNRTAVEPDGTFTSTAASGCATVDPLLEPDAFTITGRLVAAALQPTEVTVLVSTCDATGTCTETTAVVIVAVDWTGTGEVLRFRDHYTVTDGVCRQTFVGRGEAREAAATITLDGEAIAADSTILVQARSLLILSTACA